MLAPVWSWFPAATLCSKVSVCKRHLIYPALNWETTAISCTTHTHTHRCVRTEKWACVMEIDGEKHREKLNYVKVAFGKLKLKSALGRTVFLLSVFSPSSITRCFFLPLLCHHRLSHFTWSCPSSMSKTAGRSQRTSTWTSTTLLSEK